MMVGTYLGYFILFEGALGWTPGKLITGLRVVNYNGGRCTWRQAFIRSIWRIVEVNPLVLGALPAGVLIVTSAYQQRLGDRFARTLVISR